ncbi:MAG: aspartate carbamoyltransferase regulatory subunit [Thermoplasmata archaeon]|nr:aspartate carbamoyltransferase regulatory subunit [Thermoplasmata archaeon]
MKEFKVTPIRNGTVIDHIDVGMALKVLRIIGVDASVNYTVSVLMHVPSKKGGWKDIVKIEDRELDPSELDKIALVSSDATINIIRDYNVAEKFVVEVPDRVKGIMKCSNPGCITSRNEPVEPEFIVESKKPIALKCVYCDRLTTKVAENLI